MRIATIAQLLLCFVVAVSAQLTVTPLPDILFQNNSGIHNIVEQSVIWLYCTANSVNATITWTKDGVTLVNDPAHIRIRSSSSGMSSTSSLVVDNFQTSDDGSYVCQARDGMTTVNSSTLSLTASTSTLTVVTNPADSDSFPDNHITVSVSNAQVLSCVGVGSSSPPSVVWVRNGEQVVNGSRITITEGTNSFTRQRSSSLQISNFTLSDAGVYQCIFTEGAEVITTTPLRLDTGNATLERISPRVIVLDPPEKLVIETRASGGYRQFDWTRNGNPFTLTPGQPFTITLQEFSNFFEIFVREPTTANDLGVYEVELILNTGPQVPEVDFIVTQYNTPTTMNLNGTVTVQEGDSVNIACFSSGNPVPTISWYLGGSLAPFSQSGTVQSFSTELVGPAGSRQLIFTEGNITSVLQITNAVYPAHDGEYTCVGLNSNRAGDDTKNATITVQVQVPPEVEVTATLTRVVVGNSTTLTCTVTRSNPMGSYTYTWVHNNSITLGETSSMLTVSILTESNLGVYCCEVTNSAGLSGSNTTTIERRGCAHGTIRLVGGTSSLEGRVELCVNGLWGTVCSDGWTAVDANVACRQLGYSGSDATAFTNAHFGQGTTPILVDDVACTVYESRLIDCPYDSNVADCTHSEDAGVQCVPQCTHGSIRLRNGSTGMEGRVEVCLNGDWGTVCHDHWSTVDSNVACRQLGFSGSDSTPYSNAHFGQNSAIIIALDDVACTVYESRLIDCPYDSNFADCTHSDDAGVGCVARCSHGGIRLRGGSTGMQGRVEVCLNGDWGTVCHDHWSTVDSNVACRQLGYSGSDSTPYSNAHFGQNSDIIIALDNVACTVYESRLIDCPYDSHVADCTHSDDAGVGCVAQCADGSIRLRGSTGMQGRVEVCLNGDWGTVCHDHWSTVDSNVACRQLGYSGSDSTPYSNAHFGQNSDIIIALDNVACTVYESRLIDCPYDSHVADCTHSDDAGVGCVARCTRGSIRLRGGSTGMEGRVEVCLNGDWGTVCDDGWSTVDANVACRQLGFSNSDSTAYSSAHFGQGSTIIIAMDDVGCTGSEASLFSCTHTTSHNCGHADDAGVQCVSRCAHGTIRLIGGTSSLEGRVEVCVNGLWGTVCSDGWTAVDANVACRQLGYSGSDATAFTNAHFGQGTTPILVDDVACTVYESRLIDCPYDSNVADCTHSDDAGVQCVPRCTHGSIRLRGGPTSINGRVEVCLNGDWGTVCDDGWSTVDSNVACRQLGYSGSDSTPYSNAHFGQNSAIIIALDDIACTVYESRLIDCPYDSHVADCTHSEDAGVQCVPLCTHGSIRLRSGSTIMNGRVEVCLNGDWGTVCDDGWSTVDANVACRQLGFSDSDSTAYSSAYFGQGSTIIIAMDDVACTGSEASLFSCTHTTSHNCGHADDAGVQCVSPMGAQLTVTPLPNVLFQNNSGVHNIVEQSVIWLYCTANSTNATITWTKNGVTLVNDPTHIRIRSSSSGVSTTSSLVVDNFQSSDNGSYVCQGRDGVLTMNSSTLSLTASTNTLTVMTHPTDSDSFPDNRIAVPVGSNQMLRCVGSGSSSPPSVVWVRNGEQVVNGSRITITEGTNSFSRQRSSSLQITNFSLSDAGVYQCIFTEGTEVITTTPLRLDTGNATLERVSPRVIVLDPPEKLVIETRASGGYRQFDWTKNEYAFTVTQGQPFTVTLQEFPNFFEIFVREPTTANDLGVYEVDLTLNTGSQVPEIDFTVTPYNAPLTMNLNGIVTIQEGDSVNITCVSSGNPVPTISWYLRTSPAPFSQNDTVINFTSTIVGSPGVFSFTEGNITSVLQITNAAYPAHDGQYTCVGLNSHRTGDSTSNATITVQVQVMFNITFPPDGQAYTVNEADPVTFTCSATGIPLPEITWMRNGVRLDGNVDPRISVSDPETVPNGNIISVSRNLTMSSTRGNDSGIYTCVASNENTVTPNVTQDFRLFVNVIPSIFQPPENLTVVQPQSATFLCNATARPRPEITWWRMGSQLMEQPGVIEISNTTFGERVIVSNLTIIMADPSDAGGYICMANNVVGQDTTAAELTVHVIPNITFPVDSGFTYAVNETYPVTFTCSATGIPPPEITWMRNGAPFDQSNIRVTLSDPTMPELLSTGEGSIYFVSRNLTLDNTMDADSGTYTCVASNGNAVDPTDMQNFELFVRVPPTILDPPENLTVVQPQSATFLCNATARPRPEITWWRMGSQLMEQPGVFEISSSTFGKKEILSNLTIILADPSDAGGYACMATNVVGQDTAATELTVHVIPNITFPVDDGFTYTVNETYPVTFTCSATGIPPPEITWMKNGAPFDQSNTRVTLSDPTMPKLLSTGGGNIYFVSRNLTLDNTMDVDSGTYTCVASNGNAVNPTDMQNFTLFVRVAPTILEPPENLTVVQPQSATFLCNATARPRPEITWWRMGSQLMEQPGVIEISSSTFGEREILSNLTIIMADPSDAGVYVCMATNAAGQDTAAAELTVHITPNITFPVDDSLTYTVNETDPVTFTCSATGIPPPEITWMRNGVVLDGSADSRISLSNPSDPETVSTAGGNSFSVSRILAISNTMDNDSDTYTCVASNGNAVTPSVTQNFTLEVQVAPQILDSPDSLTVVEPQDATFSCLATGRPRPDIVWTRLSDMAQLQNQPGVYRIEEQEIGDREKRSNLTIVGTQPSDAGAYACMAVNEPGSATQQATLTVHVVPNITFPTDGLVYIVNETDPVTFTCSATGIPPPEITWMRNGAPFDQSNTRVTLSDPTMPELFSTGGGNIYFVSRNLTLDNTMDADSGTYTCVASNGNTVDPTDMQNFTLFVRVPSTILEPPENLTVVQPQSATFLCNATARPRPEITWWRMGSQLMEQPGMIETSSSTFGEREIMSNLTIIMADPSDAGGYVCNATNVVGQDTAAAGLTVYVIPNITFPVDDGFTYTVNKTDPVTFTCSATGIPPPEITWMRNEAPFNQSNIRVTLSDPTMPELFSTGEGSIYFVSRNLTLDNTMDADSGTYTCVASNGNAVDPTDLQNFELFVRVPPTILEPPENLTVVQPQSATFLCNATARPRPEITWWRMGSQLMIQPEVIEISTSTFGDREIVSNLTIIMADPSDAGGYICIATNVVGQDTTAADLIVHVIPEIFPNDNSTGYIVNVTDPVTFVCTATGIPPPTIQWFRDGVLLSSGVVLSEPSQTMVPAPMGTGMIYRVERTLTFNTAGSDTDAYTCEASNINVVQPTTAQNFTLFVQVPPIVVPLAPRQQVIGNETGSATLSFRIDSAAPPVLLQDLRWFYVANFRIDDPYAGQEITNLTNRTTESMLTFSNLTDMRYVSLTVSNIVQQRVGIGGETDEGRYFLVATNPAGVTFSYIDLLVYGPPLIFVPPVDRFEIDNGSSAVFQCEASAVPDHNVFWTFTNSSGSTRAIISTTESDTDKYQVKREREIGAGFGELTILDVQYEDRGRYACTAMNSLGSDVSNASLTVHVYPIINNVSSLTEVNVSRPATLVCLTTGFPLPSISWQKEGEEVMLTMDGQISTFSFDTGSMSSSFESSGFMSSGSIEGLIESMTEFNTRDLRSLGELGVVSVLSFDRLEREDTANYTCTATNSLPQTTTLTALSPSIPLVVLEVPDPPVSIMVFDMGARWLALRWTPTFDGNRPITSFVIYQQNINQSSSFMSLGSLQASNLIFRDGNFMYNVTTGVLPFTNYSFMVRACNVLGCGNVSQPSPTVMTLPDVPTASQNVTLSMINQRSIMVTWEKPTMPNGILGLYIVSYTGTKSYNSTFHDTGSRSVREQMVVLTGLTSDTNYSIVVIATNTAGFRNSSDAVVGTTLTGPSESTTALFQLRLRPVRECVTWVDERRTQKFMEIVSAVVQQAQMRCLCDFTETNIQNYEFSCRSIENTVVFRAQISYTSLQQARYRADSLVTLVSAWAQSGTSIVVDSTRLDIDPTCPTQLGSFEDDDCQLVLTDPSVTDTTSTDPTGTVGGNVAIVGAIGGVVGVVCVLLIICSIMLIIFVVQRKRKHRTFSPAVETYEIPELPVDDSIVKVNPATSENVITSSNPAYGHFRISRQTKEDDRKKQGTISPTDYEIPEVPVDDAIVKVNPARSENVISSSNPAFGHFQSSRQENDTKEDEEEDHTYEPLPFDTPRQ